MIKRSVEYEDIKPPGQPRTLAVHLAVNPFRGISSLALLSPVFHGGYDMFKSLLPDQICLSFE